MTRTLWDTPNLQETLEALLDEGYTAGEAARALTKRFGVSISRNAVIGRAYRTKTALKRAHRRQYTDEQRIAVKLLKEEELRERVAMQQRVIECNRLARERSMMVEPKPKGDVEHGCRYLHGEASKRKFCGAPVRPLTSWCEYHHTVVYVASKKPELGKVAGREVPDRRRCLR